jgi:AcrR family transcriptional regulator
MSRLKNLTERGHETQRQLRDVLVELSLEKGYEQISVKDIVERAGIDRSTFYLHFKSKEELFNKSQEMLVDDLVARLPQNPVPFAGIAVTFEHMAQNTKIYQVLLELSGDNHYMQFLHDYVVQTVKPIIEQHLLKQVKGEPKIELDLLTNFLIGAFRSTARWWLKAGQPHSPAEMTEKFRQLAMRGMISLLD